MFRSVHCLKYIQEIHDVLDGTMPEMSCISNTPQTTICPKKDLKAKSRVSVMEHAMDFKIIAIVHKVRCAGYRQCEEPTFHTGNKALLCHPCSERDWNSSYLQQAVLRRWLAQQKTKIMVKEDENKTMGARDGDGNKMLGKSRTRVCSSSLSLSLSLKSLLHQ
jgi:hypothetical protein